MASSKLHRRIASWFGYDLVRLEKNHLTSELHLRSLLARLSVNCVIDVGANRGQYGLQLRRLGYRGRIVSFEPVAASFAALEQARAADAQWRTYRCALGAMAGRGSIQVQHISELSSLCPPSPYFAERFAAQSSATHNEEVEIRRLDAVFAEATAGIAEPRVFVKVDTQGYDLQVLAGAAGCLSHVVGLQTEISLRALYVDVPDYLSALAKLRSLGFEPTGFYPVCRDESTLALVEMDCILRRAAE